MAPITALAENLLVSSHMWLDPARDATAAFFAHHAASSHTACGVMGVVIAAWIRGFTFVFPSLCPGERPAPVAVQQKGKAEPTPAEPAAADNAQTE
jgi:hypothetical protein